jgi:hypothetical protein
VRELLGIGLVLAGVLLAPLAIFRDWSWWIVAGGVALVGTILYLTDRVVRREKRLGSELDDRARGHGLGLGPTYRSGNVNPRAGGEDGLGDTFEADGD